MDIKQLKFLVALDETRHFGQAAARCHVTQPTLSMRLRSLEEIRALAQNGKPVRLDDECRRITSRSGGFSA